MLVDFPAKLAHLYELNDLTSAITAKNYPTTKLSNAKCRKCVEDALKKATATGTVLRPLLNVFRAAAPTNRSAEVVEDSTLLLMSRPLRLI